ncbi:MAG: hypothetical protein GDA56_02215 [Hormoscilla sp. GM7CHS1pb]|nr:hypothetical protein [Hormoscilla sp. GM7CHS1pb]
MASNLETILRGSEADNILTGGGGNDCLTGHGGNDTLTGGAGEDAFFFTTDSAGIDIIADFEVGVDTLDVIDLSLGVSDVNALIAGAQQSGADVLLTFGDKHQVHLQGVQTTALSIDSFVFLPE